MGPSPDRERFAAGRRLYYHLMRRILTLVLRVASVPVGVGVGLWTAQLTTVVNECTPQGVCLLMLRVGPRFATWQCALFGAGAAAVLLLLSFAVARLPTTTRPLRAA